MIIVLVSVALLAAAILTALPGTTRSRIGDAFGPVFDPMLGFFQKTSESISGYFGAVSKNNVLRRDKLALEEEIARLNLLIMENEDKVKAYAELKDALHLVTAFEESNITGASVLNRDMGPLFDLFRIRAGRLHGITVSAGSSLPVVDRDMALIGRVHSTELSSSKVMPLVHEAFAVSARVEGTPRASFRVRGDLELREQGLCLGDLIAEGTPVAVGDRLVTSGESGVYPEGIIIGEVIELRHDQQGKILSCVVQPAAALVDVSYVFILTEKQDES